MEFINKKLGLTPSGFYWSGSTRRACLSRWSIMCMIWPLSVPKYNNFCQVTVLQDWCQVNKLEMIVTQTKLLAVQTIRVEQVMSSLEYRSMSECIWSFNIPTWYSTLSAKSKKKLSKIVRIAEKVMCQFPIITVKRFTALTLNQIFPPPLQVRSSADQSGIGLVKVLQQRHQGGTLWVPHGGWYWGRQCEYVWPEGHLQTHQGRLQKGPGYWLYSSDDG